jgi:hypothetical protein
MACDITCVITGHREGRLAVASLRSFVAAAEACRQAGLAVQCILVLDRPNNLTREIFAAFCEGGGDIVEVDFGDQGRARNVAVERAEGEYIAFLDADDIWAGDWLLKAHSFLKERGGKVIAHPEFNYFFEGLASIFCHIDQEDERFDMDLLRIVNFWDALCMCPTDAYRDHPFGIRAIADGWAYEDWHWNCETIAAGYVHKVVPDTVLFKRRQASSQTIRAAANQSRIRKSAMASYSWPGYPDAVENE